MNAKLKVGDRVKLGATKRQWTVRGVTAEGRFAILTQPFNPKRTVLYTVIDFKLDRQPMTPSMTASLLRAAVKTAKRSAA